MRCDTVIRELSTPSGTLDRAALALHLADCPKCASFSAQVHELQTVWDLTRPAEPSADAFDAMWTRVVIAAEQPALVPFAPAPRWKRWGLASMVAAQAAGLLIAGGLAWNHRTGGRASAPVMEFTARPGTTLIVTLDGPAGTVPTVHVSDESVVADAADTDMVAADFDVLNYMESL